MKKRIIKKHVNALWRATCIYETRSVRGLTWDVYDYDDLPYPDDSDNPENFFRVWEWRDKIVTVKRASKPLSGRHMRALLYRFQARRYVPEFQDVIFLDEMPDNGQWKFTPRRKYALTADDQNIGFLRRAADMPTRRQVEAEQREIESLERGVIEWWC